MVINLLESTKLILVDQESSNMHIIKENLEGKEMDIYTHMVQLDMLNTDFEKIMCKKPAENHLVNIT